MTDEKINCAIADACGFTVELSHMQSGIDVIRDGKRKPLPDYCNDLNAMYEAEKIFCNCSIRREYADEVALACDANWRYDAIHATARQRAEAFLRTLGKWEDGK